MPNIRVRSSRRSQALAGPRLHNAFGPTFVGHYSRRSRCLGAHVLLCLLCCTICISGDFCLAANVCPLESSTDAAAEGREAHPSGTTHGRRDGTLDAAVIEPEPADDRLAARQEQDKRAVDTNDRDQGNPTMKSMTLAAGKALPFLYGTAWKKERTADLVQQAVLAGFRGIDVACQPRHYREDLVGTALKRLAEEHGIARNSLWLQTKYTPVRGQDPENTPYDPSLPPPEQAMQSVQKSLENLGTDRIDSLLLHSPLSTGEETLEVWQALEAAVDNGTIGQLGISNLYDPEMFKWLHSSARHKPAVLQNRFYEESGYDKELREFCLQNGVTYQSFWTLTANPHILTSDAVQRIAERLSASAGDVTPAQVLFKFLIQSGHQPLTGTTSLLHMEQDLAAPGLPDLSDSEMQAITALLE